MIKLFVGYDERESVVFHAFNQSVLDNTKAPVSITPLHEPMLNDFDGQRDGSNRFIYSRYLVPYLCGYEGWAIFCDGDMIALGDLQELWELRDDKYAALVVKHNYETSSPRKYLGTPLESDNVNYPCKNWSSVVLWNCGHPENKILTPYCVQTSSPKFLHRFQWLLNPQIGNLPEEWNLLVDEQEMTTDPKLIHYTLGCPGIEGYRDCSMAKYWHDALLKVNQLAGQDATEMVGRADGHRRSSNGCGESQARISGDRT